MCRQVIGLKNLWTYGSILLAPIIYGIRCSLSCLSRDKKISKKKVIYWMNEGSDLSIQKDDIIQWWGSSIYVGSLEKYKNKVILSDYKQTYLDLGFGNIHGNSYGKYIAWKEAYSFEPKVKNVNIIGGESAIWSELNSGSTHDVKVWSRTSVIAERLWDTNIILAKNELNIFKRLVSHNERMRKRGYKVASISSGLCEKEPEVCFE